MARPIVVDAMTAEQGPGVAVEGARQAMEQYGCKVILVGDESKLERLTKEIPIVHSSQVITNNEGLLTLARKVESSQAVGIGLVKKKKADAFVSAGSTAATGYFAISCLGTIEGVKKPPIVQRVPSIEGTNSLFGDVGFLNEYGGRGLFILGLMMSLYAETMFDITSPKIALLTVGSEDYKGPQEVKEANELFRRGSVEKQGINFVGNMEPDDIILGNADCFVCSGEVGNVSLKMAEAMAKYASFRFKEGLVNSGYLSEVQIKEILSYISQTLNRSNYGGALMLGVKKGVVVVTHGMSDEIAMRESIRVAQEAVECKVPKKIEKGLARYLR